MKKLGFNYRLFFQNLGGSMLILVPAFVLILSRNHESYYAIQYGIFCGVVASLLITGCFLFFDPVVSVELEFARAEVLIKKKDVRLWTELLNKKFAISKSNMMYGDIEISLASKVKLVGSKYRISKLIK